MACEDNPRDPDYPALTLPAGMVLAVGLGLGRLLTAGYLLRSVAPAVSLTPPPPPGPPSLGGGTLVLPPAAALNPATAFGSVAGPCWDPS